MSLLARSPVGRNGGRSRAGRSVAAVRELASVLPDYSGDEIRAAVKELRDAIDESDPTWLTRVGALVFESFRRVRGIDLYETQIRAGLILCDRPSGGRGYVAEMQTGEGKTFVAAFPAVAFALHGRGVHVATSNKYLAERDAELLRPIFEFLDLSVAALPEATDGGTAEEKRAAYLADITYGPGYEFGFDYLRDQLARRESRGHRTFHERYRNPIAAERTQRPLFAAVIDEVDHVLLDDAVSPLVLATAGAEEAADAAVHRAARELALELSDEHVSVRGSRVTLTDVGRDAAWERCDDQLAALLKRPWLDYVTQAVHAERIFKRDVHYIIDGDKAQIVDPSTGRIFNDRTWSDGLHQAVEAKEVLPVRDGNRTLARITRQRFAGLYQRLCGMTGTARGSEKEFRTIYGLDIEQIETHRPSQRVVGPLLVFADDAERWSQVAAEVRAIHADGRPVLVGTTSVSSSQRIADELVAANIPFELLNGIQDADEAEIVTRAGEMKAVTVATGLAGRGTDIALGPGVRELGGLHVIVCEMQSSARVERQLVGRAARQGDPGTASRYLSADDDYLEDAGPWLSEQIRRGRRHGLEKAVREVQRRADQQASKRRVAMWKHDGQRDDLVARLARRMR